MVARFKTMAVLGLLVVSAVAEVQDASNAASDLAWEGDDNMDNTDLSWDDADMDLSWDDDDTDATADFEARMLRKKKKPKPPQPKCKPRLDSQGNDLCKKNGGRCVKNYAACMRITKKQGFFIPKLCQTGIAPIDKTERFCGCCIKRNNKAKPLDPSTLEVRTVGGAALPDGGKLSLAMSSSPSNAGALSELTKLTMTILPENDAICCGYGITIAPNTAAKFEPQGSNYKVEVPVIISSERFREIKGLEPIKQTESDGSFDYEVPQTVPGKMNMVLGMKAAGELMKKLANQGVKKATQMDDFVTNGAIPIRALAVQLQPTSRMALKPKTIFELSSSSSSLQLAFESSLTIRPELELELVPLPNRFWPPLILQEEKRSICIQPVRLRHRTCGHNPWFGFLCFYWNYFYSGAGLNFGRPMADDLWGEADITFDWQPWKTVVDNAGKYEVVTSAEESSLRSKVQDDDCIEVFFVPKFSPSDLHGGGACWGSGTAGAQIITSDEQVSCGVDQTHLAHELGHVLGLMHPNTGSATFADGSKGTLLCGSGWERDNPRRNSVDNANNIQNPLLNCYFDIINWFNVPECQGDPACGECAAHIPPDAC